MSCVIAPGSKSKGTAIQLQSEFRDAGLWREILLPPPPPHSLPPPCYFSKLAILLCHSCHLLSFLHHSPPLSVYSRHGSLTAVPLVPEPPPCLFQFVPPSFFASPLTLAARWLLAPFSFPRILRLPVTHQLSPSVLPHSLALSVLYSLSNRIHLSLARFRWLHRTGWSLTSSSARARNDTDKRGIVRVRPKVPRDKFTPRACRTLSLSLCRW